MALTIQELMPRLAPIVALLLFATPAVAEDSKVAARQYYKRGMAAFTLERYDEAIKHFQEGFLVEPDPIFLFNVAQAFRLSHRPEQAITFYQKYLAAKPNAPNRSSVVEQIDALKRQMAEAKLSPPNLPPSVSDLGASKVPEAKVGPRNESVPTPSPSVTNTARPLVTDPPPAPLVRRRTWPIWVGVAAGVIAVGAAATVIGIVTSEHTTESSAIVDATGAMQ